MGVGAEALPSPRAGAELAPLGSIPRVPAAGATEPGRQQELGRYPLVSPVIVGHAPRAVNDDGDAGKPGRVRWFLPSKHPGPGAERQKRYPQAKPQELSSIPSTPYTS